MMHRGDLFILSAPSGAGKTTLIRNIFAHGPGADGSVAFSVSHTTRKPRAGEVDGEDYHFVDHDTFQEMIAADHFVEWAEVHNNYYGTANSEVLPRLAAGIDVLLDIDVKGAERVMQAHPQACSIFIMPPGYAVLEQRLRQRGLDDPGDIARRLAVSRWEIKRFTEYQYVILNDDADEASTVLGAIILEKRHRCDRMKEAVASVLDDFGRGLQGAAVTI